MISSTLIRVTGRNISQLIPDGQLFLLLFMHAILFIVNISYDEIQLLIYSVQFCINKTIINFLILKESFI